MKVNTGRAVVSVSSLQAASAAVLAVTAEMGASEWYGLAKKVGLVTDDLGNFVAVVSYNGKAWDRETHLANAVCVFNPYV